jgi:deoxyribodipyrimidine photo-lyase
MNNKHPQRIRLIWHRRDLRLTDNGLYSNLDHASVSLYVLDPAFFEPRPSTTCPQTWDTVWTGPYAWNLIIYAVIDLRKRLQELGSDLLVRVGDPASIVPTIAEQVDATEVWWHEEPGTYEMSLSEVVRKALCDKSIFCNTHVGITLYHPDDLPRTPDCWARHAQPKQKYKKKGKAERDGSTRGDNSCSANRVDITPGRWSGMPPIMGNFRTAARGYASIRPALDIPTRLIPSTGVANIDQGQIPSLRELCKPLLSYKRAILGLESTQISVICRSAQAQHNRDRSDARGSESWALERVHHFVNGGYAGSARRNMADVSGDDSSKLSAALAIGSISPRTVYEAVTNADDEHCRWLASHLEMRDFFLYSSFAAGPHIYKVTGLPVRSSIPPRSLWRDPSCTEEWRHWSNGTTLLPLVDAAIKELLATGYCSNRVRQNAASVLANDLMLDWRAGAELFQFLLEDHCVAANWGNWMYFAGVGSDPKNRHFRTVSQALRYDPDGKYVSRWLPRLREADDLEAKLRPWELLEDWNFPIVNPWAQLTWAESRRLSEFGRLSDSSGN